MNGYLTLKENNMFSWKQGLKKTIRVLVLFLLPYLVDQFIINVPQIAQISIGSLLVLITDFLKRKVGLRLP